MMSLPWQGYFGGKYNVRNLQWVPNTLAKLRLDMTTLTVSKDRICLFVWKKKEKLFRASLSFIFFSVSDLVGVILWSSSFFADNFKEIQKFGDWDS